MAQTITIEVSRLNKIMKTLFALQAEVASLVKNTGNEPAYGSDEWWEWSDKKAEADIKANKTVKFDSVDKAIEWLNS